MIAAHTPGPWTLGKVRTGDQYINDVTGTPIALAMLQDNVDANARLIAAAPDLLWLVQSWVEWPDHESGPASVAARLAKARALLTRVATGGGDE